MIVDRHDGPITDDDIAAAQQALAEVPNIGFITAVSGMSEDGRAASFNVAFPTTRTATRPSTAQTRCATRWRRSTPN